MNEPPTTTFLMDLPDQPSIPSSDAVTEPASTIFGDPLGDGETPPDESQGRWIGDYLVLEALGGGMGLVYRAFHRHTKSFVAFKVIRAEWSGDRTDPGELPARRYFQREFEVLARLDHPNIVPLYDAGHAEGILYFSMRLIRGADLSKIRREEGPLDPLRAAIYVEEISRAIQYVHDQGVIHRDLKPANIMIDGDDRAILIDLGLAKRLESTDPTRLGKAMGTAAYMSPEQAMGSPDVDFTTDVYGLGATLYTLLHGRAPFQGADDLVILAKVIHNEVEWPAARDGIINPELKAICLKCLEKDPKDRFASAQDLAEALSNFRNHKPNPNLAPPGIGKRIEKLIRRQPWRAATAAVAALALLGFVVGLGLSVYRDRNVASLLVRDVATIPLDELSRKIAEMTGYHYWTDPELRQQLARATSDPVLQTRFRLALLPSDPSQADALADRLLACEPSEHPLIREALRPHWERVGPKIRAAANNPRAAVALIALDPRDSAWPTLKLAEIPDARMELLDWIIRARIDVETLFNRLDIEPDPSIRRMIIQALGALGDGTPAPGVCTNHLDQIRDLYRNDPDRGIHSSIAYLMRRWGNGEMVKNLDVGLAGKPRENREWFVTKGGRTMVVLDGPAEKNQAPYQFAIATTEVTYRDFAAMDPEYLGDREGRGQYPQPSADAAADGVNYDEAIRFCNRLSASEGLPESEWCYVPGKDEGSLALAPNYLDRKGYRLPTLDEWLLAARSGTTARRYFGDSERVVSDYAWHRGISPQYIPSQVGLLRPNDFGLFDAIGNVMEWCRDLNPNHDPDCKCKGTSAFPCQIRRFEVVRGISFGQFPNELGVVNQKPLFRFIEPHIHWPFVGFRVVKLEIPR